MLGVVLFRLPRESRAGYIRLVEFVLAQVKLDDFAGAIAVVSPDTVRVLTSLDCGDRILGKHTRFATHSASRSGRPPC